MQRIGIFGGSFDPIHYGHLILAEQIKELSGLDKVIFVPANINPFKVGHPPAEGADRMRMTEIAVSGCQGFEVSDIELKRGGPSYTYDTLTELSDNFRKKGEDVKLYFILGSDSLKKISAWKKGSELIDSYGLISIYRKGEDPGEIDEEVQRIRKIHSNADIKLFETPELEISSNDIREKLRFGQSIKFLTPDSVIEYIDNNKLYDSITRRLGLFVRENVKPRRYAHTLRVLAKCREYGKRYGVNIEKLEIAAIFHDAYRDCGNLEHGPLAAEHLEKDFGVTDPEILEAVRYHTIGHAGLSRLGMVLKLSDTLEDGREFSEAPVLRAKLTDDLEESMLLVMERIKAYVLRSGDDRFDETSQAFIDWLRDRLRKRAL